MAVAFTLGAGAYISSMTSTIRCAAATTAIAAFFCAHAQLGDEKAVFTKADTLRGSIGAGRAWWNATHYDVSVIPDFNTRSIQGTTIISFSAVAPGHRMQIDLQQPLVVDSITASVDVFRDGAFLIGEERVTRVERDGNVLWVDLPDTLKSGDLSSITVYYHGTPRAAKNPPWDGGWIWKTDAQGNPWMSVACQGLGASVWYPCKDHQSDEPDAGAMLHITVPDTLQAVGNGRLQNTSKHGNGTSTWHWVVTSPINLYNLVPYIGKYAHFSEAYAGLNGKLDCDYWVLAYNEAKAREQFKQVKPMLTCFEDWFGPYPFYQDGYKLVESPHLGMEHQSAVAYGNQYMNGYLGRDLSGTGHGLQWDYIIIHESGHEWFGNNITTADIADMWVHEGFTMYSEVVFTECLLGKEAANAYAAGVRKNIANDKPIIGPYGVNQEGSGDMYYKGAALVHTIRQVTGDSVFKAMMRAMHQRFRFVPTTSTAVEDFIITFNENTRALLNKSIFDQYLRDTRVPVLEYGVKKKEVWVRWTNCVEGFTMPVGLLINGERGYGTVSTQWIKLYTSTGRKATVELDANWYATTHRAGKATAETIPSGKVNGNTRPTPYF